MNRHSLAGPIRVVILGLAACSAPTALAALPFVSPIFGDHMVLQRDETNVIWGWTTPDAEVTVEVNGKQSTGTAGADGKWTARIEPVRSTKPFAIRVTGLQTVELRDVLAGDVWLCGGQSNMEFPLSRAERGDEEVAAAHHPQIRLFKVRTQSGYSPQSTVQGTWRVCSPESVAQDGGFSAVGYFFGRRLHADLKVPIGLIQSAQGGTPAETWTSTEALRRHGGFDVELSEVDRLAAKSAPPYGNYIMHWYDEYDAGAQGKTWADANLADADWADVKVPGGFAELGVGGVPSVCYFRKHVNLPDPLPAGKATIRLGVIEKMDTTHINGQWVGASAWVENPRVYAINDGVLKPGRNLICIRVFKLKPDGGFQSKADDLRLVLGDGTSIPLAGEWKGKVSVDARPPHPLPIGFENWPVMPSVLYNGMIKPLAPLGLTGAIWYQGEANASRAFQYRTLLPAMIADWRRTFAQGDFPFYIVSLASFMPRRAAPGDDAWAELREAQALTARNVFNSGLAVAIDIGDASDIHPKNKKDVGERLALWALASRYGRDVECSGPVFSKMEHVPGGLKLHFDHAKGGLVVRGSEPGEFAVAGEDRKWHPAKGIVNGSTVTVSSTAVEKPVAARYAWQANPVANLYNKAGLPAVPFRTDDWR
jgi:sialate O-acetylesterase